ncbi:MAG: CsgG/HfaB family protein [Xanthobacteraceae bacterium]|nr:CsgG/HfaB family protein [Xanthobacteraceae bacterium]
MIVAGSALGLLAAHPVAAQKLGVGGTGVDESVQLPTCEKPIGTVALVQEKPQSDPRMDALPEHLRAMVDLANAQRAGGPSVDPLPLLKLLAARSRCFIVVDRGVGFDALQRERAIAAGQGGATPAPSLAIATHLLSVSIVYLDAKSRQSAGGVGGFMGGIGFSQKTMEAQALLTLTSVKTGVQDAVASGSARKKDVGILFGGLSDLGVGALGGSYASTDMGKITSLALLDGFRKLVADARVGICGP